MADLVCPVVQIAVGLCFGTAALAKARAFQFFVEGVASYRMVPEMVVRPFSGTIVVTEALVAACFLSSVLVTRAALAASFLLIVSLRRWSPGFVASRPPASVSGPTAASRRRRRVCCGSSCCWAAS